MMNTLINEVKSVYLIGKQLGICIQASRNFKSNLKIKWVRPPEIPCFHPSKSGDLEFKLKSSSNELAFKYEKSAELKDAPDIVKKLFTLEYMPMKETAVANYEKARDLVKRHEGDYKSAESHLAIMTSEIRHLQEYMEKHPRNKKCKVFLKELIDRRKKYLSDLRRWDYKRFEWILEKLNIVYKPYPELWLKPTRKDSLRKLTAKHCDEIKEKKLNSYRAELEAQQNEFFKEKANKLAFIRAEEIACGLEPTVSEQEIQVAREKAGLSNQ